MVKIIVTYIDSTIIVFDSFDKIINHNKVVELLFKEWSLNKSQIYSHDSCHLMQDIALKFTNLKKIQMTA